MDSLFFIATKVIWLFVQPDVWILLLCIAATVACYRGRLAVAKKILGALLALIVAISLLPMGEWLMYPLETRFETPEPMPAQIDGIISLGGGELSYLAEQWQQPEFNQAVERYTVLIPLINQYPAAQVVVSSGSGSLGNQSQKGADVIKAFLQQQGVDTGKIIFERESRNTYENLLFSKAKLQASADARLLLVTSAYHMPRAVGVAKKLGLNVIPYPVDHYGLRHNIFRIQFNFANNLLLLKEALHEYLGLLGYAVFGKSAGVFPG